MDDREAREARLKRLKRKRCLIATILLVCFVGLCGSYWTIVQRNERKEEEKAKREQEEAVLADRTVVIAEFPMTDVKELKFANEEASYHFVWVDSDPVGGWVRQGEEDFPTNDTKVQNIIACFSALTGTKRIPAKDVDLSAYGVEKGKMFATVKLTDGSEHTFVLGDRTPYEDGYYLLYENTGDVFVVSENVHTQLTTKEIKLVESEIFPSAVPEQIMELRIECRDGKTLSFTPTEEADGSLTYPPLFYDSTRFVASTIQEYNCKDFAKYGLDEPYVTVSIDYLGLVFSEDGRFSKDVCTMVLEVGDKTVSGNYYVRVNGSDFVYIMLEIQARKYLSLVEE